MSCQRLLFLIMSVVGLAVGNLEFGNDKFYSKQSVKKNYTINRTWDNKTISDNAEIHISFSLSHEPGSNRKSVQVDIDAPFYNDPSAPEAPTTDPFPGLWEYEVVEAFFLGNNDEYLELEFAPSGHYLLLYLKGVRQDTGTYLPLTQYTSQIVDDDNTLKKRWIGKAYIPASYFPCNVTKFNAYAIHNSDPNRIYMSLFPVADGELQAPDFHYLDAFQSISFDDPEVNPLCHNGHKYQYKIEKTWDNKTTSDNAEIFLSFSIQNQTESQNKLIIVEFDAPFYNDPKAPDAPTIEPFPGLWEYEVVEAFFLGDDEEYLELEFAPSGHYLLLYLKGVRQDTGTYLPLTQYTSQIVDDDNTLKKRWIGKAYIPASYFPCNVTKFNAYNIHNSDPNRVYMSLFPVTGGQLQGPDFHYLDAFRSIYFAHEINQRRCDDKKSEATATSGFDRLFTFSIMALLASCNHFLF